MADQIRQQRFCLTCSQSRDRFPCQFNFYCTQQAEYLAKTAVLPPAPITTTLTPIYTVPVTETAVLTETTPSTTENNLQFPLSNSPAMALELVINNVFTRTEQDEPTIAHTTSYDGFGAGPHILQVSTYRGDSNVDAFTTPGAAPFNDPDPTSSYTRYEEDHANWLYNGVPFTQTAQSWTRREIGVADKASNDQVIWSDTAGDTATLTVNGEWINIGFAADSSGGSADIYLDGAYQRTVSLYLDDQFIGTLDLFNSTDISRTFSFDGLGSGVHLLRLEQHHGNITLEDFTTPAVLPLYNPPAPSGIIRYEEDDPALRYNGVPYTQTVASWSGATYKQFASDGYYVESALSGDNVSLDFNGTWVGIGFVTWRTRGMADVPTTRTFSFDGLGAGPHVIDVRRPLGWRRFWNWQFWWHRRGIH